MMSLYEKTTQYIIYAYYLKFRTAMTWYVVYRGRQSGVFSSWEECHTQVNGFKGARYKGYKSKYEAVAAYNSQVIQAEL